MRSERQPAKQLPAQTGTAAIRALFATQILEASLAETPDFPAFNAALAQAWRDAGRRGPGRAGLQCREHGYPGYTSYASLDDLPRRASVFGELKRRLDRHAARFAADLAFDLGPRGRLKLDSLWVSVLKPGGAHAGHIHPHSVLSGTVYVAVPPGAGALRLEDPRLPLMMAAPPRLADAPLSVRTFVTLTPAVGALYMWESWLRHEVLPSRAKTPRVSISFNYAWK